ncbi:hypothetical protein BKA64DRAFT_667927 [Cadophora sp. MPI-SDFR-AT-0126]|nr:hypothetical protein BKA64DRAFT_667927 [Leotiomycetes sp. MPI-SDFR-AT-0126]
MANKTNLCHIHEPGDPDVAGLGVTVSFLANIILTAITILILYFRSELENHSARYNSIDRAFVCFVTRNNHHRKEQGARHDAINAALWRLLENLSDQQLITGTALAIPVYIRLADSANYSVYSFGMATTTIYLSCLTHMCTLIALGDKFWSSGRQWSLIAMLLLLVLMAPILLISNFPTFIIDPSLSVKCAFKQFTKYGSLVTLIFGLQATLILDLVISGYIRRMIDVFRQSKRLRNHTTTSPTLLKSVLNIIPDKLSRAEAWREREKRQIVEHELSSLETMTAIRLLVAELRASYLWELFWLSFYYNFGIASVVLTWTTLPPLSQWSLSFGQLIPIMMLVFGLVPIYSEYRERRDKSEDQFQENVSGATPPVLSSYTIDIPNSESIRPSPPDESIPPKNENPDAIFEQSNVAVRQQRQRQQGLQAPLGPKLPLYQVIESRYSVLTRTLVVSVGLLSFLVLQLLASILSGVFAPFIVRSPIAWLYVSLIPWMVLACSFAATTLQCMRDVHSDRRRT